METKRKHIREMKLCFNCLRGGHTLSTCRSSTCRKCHQRHNTLLHEEYYSPRPASTTQSATTQQKSSLPDHNAKQAVAQTHASSIENGGTTHVLLFTTIVIVDNSKGHLQPCRALLHCGSTHRFISTDLCRQLKLKCGRTDVIVTGINSQLSQSLSKTSVHMADAYRMGFRRQIHCLTLQEISAKIPTAPVERSSLRLPEDIQLADRKVGWHRSFQNCEQASDKMQRSGI
jgi:hypothetical protein